MPRTIQITGGNLFAIAAAQMGDALQGVRIAVANNLTDPVLPTGAPVTLVIPDPLDPSLSTGLPNP
jgi:hypothetical protein